ncbi:hypothetical protein WR25_17601 [Diploscapter pachys]|uniref:Chromo shadow domain-containing protein n=1 Tax=Diploscapter pachys TaxID=2018661 RepID=A0A2A2JAR5_9BILA|nr:hypothetical protein WR25_17601 [Diploscapter pachys]
MVHKTSPTMDKPAHKSSALNQSTSLGGDQWEVRRIVDERTMVVKGRERREFLVDWAPSWMPQHDVSPALVLEYETKVEVVGPADTKNNKHLRDKNAKLSQYEWLVEKTEKNGQSARFIMPYDHILQQFPLNLIAYYEKHAVINENDDKEEQQTETPMEN